MTRPGWQELYKAALLELRPAELRLAIGTAETAIHQRLQELGVTAGWDGDEHHAIADALRNLRTLTETECKSRSGFPADGPTVREVAS